MKLSFNKQPVDKIDTSQLSLFHADGVFHTGDCVWFLDYGGVEFGRIISIGIGVMRMITRHGVKFKHTSNLFPAETIPVSSVDDLEFGDFIMIELYGENFVIRKVSQDIILYLYNVFNTNSKVYKLVKA